MRIGGNIQAPALVKRVEPVYPDIALAAKITGIVILEATVGADGSVEQVRVLRSVQVPRSGGDRGREAVEVLAARVERRADAVRAHGDVELQLEAGVTR